MHRYIRSKLPREVESWSEVRSKLYFRESYEAIPETSVFTGADDPEFEDNLFYPSTIATETKTTNNTWKAKVGT